MGFKGNTVFDTGYFYAPYQTLLKTPIITEILTRTSLCLRRYYPWWTLKYYGIAGTRSVLGARLMPRGLWRCMGGQWSLALGDDSMLPMPATECAVCLTASIDVRRFGFLAPMELWLWRDKYWVDISRLDTRWAKSTYQNCQLCSGTLLVNGVPCSCTGIHSNQFKPNKGIMTKYSKKLLREGKKYYGKITINDL